MRHAGSYEFPDESWNPCPLLWKHGVFFFFFLLIYFLIGGKLLYNVVLVSATQQQTSAIIIHISSPSWAILLSTHPIPLGHHRAPAWAPCVIAFHQLSVLHVIVYIRQCHFLCSSHSLFPLLCSWVHSLHLCLLHSFPVDRFINTIFLDSIYMCWYTIFFFFWLTSLCITDSRFIYLTRTDSKWFLLWLSVIFHCIYEPHLLYPFISRKTSRLRIVES